VRGGGTAGSPTDNVYARVFDDTFTQPDGANPVIRAQIGYGPINTNPQNQGGWTWATASFNQQFVNDDEYQLALTVATAGTYAYTSRFSRDGVNWTYCDLDGAGANMPVPDLTFDPTRLGVLIVSAVTP
jgi:hypothetical protein